MAHKIGKRAVFSLAIVLGLAVVAGVSLPLWFPWVLRPVLAHYGVRYAACERHVYQGVTLSDLTYSNEHVQVTARRVRAALPYAWLWRRHAGGDSKPMLEMADWSLRVAETTSRPQGRPQGRPKHSTPAPATRGSASSPQTALREARSKLALLRKWLPTAELRNGSVQAGSRAMDVPYAHWNGGVLSAQLTSQDWKGPMLARADFAPQWPWKIAVDLKPSDLRLDLHMAEAGGLPTISGALHWRTNQVQLAAEFGRDNWFPLRASARCDSFSVPAAELDVPACRDLTGSFVAEWTDGQFRVNANAAAQPLEPNHDALPPVRAELHAEGSTNLVRIEQARIQCPWLTAAMSPGASFDFEGRLLSPEASLEIAADLDEQHWMPARGAIQGQVVLVPGPGRWPQAKFDLSGKNVAAHGIQAGQAELQGTFNWPWLAIDRARVKLAEGGAGAFVAKVNLASRIVTNAVVHFEGRFGTNLLPARATFDHLILHADGHGPWTDLSHSGVIEVRRLAFPQTAPVDVAGAWRGKDLDLNHFEASLSATNATLTASGYTDSARGQSGLRIQTLTLQRGKQTLYTLRQPFAISLERDRRRFPPRTEWLVLVEPFRWEGPGHSIAGSADLAWPRSGRLEMAADGLETSILDPFLRIPLPPVAIQQLGFSAAWSNSPVRFAASLASQLHETNAVPFSAYLQAAGDGRGIALDRLEILSEGKAVLSGRGSFPVWYEPLNSADPVRVAEDIPMSLHAATAPNRRFWDQVNSWTRLGLVDPAVTLDLSGPIATVTGKITARVAGLHPQFSTNRPLPRLENLQAEVALSRRAARLDQFHVLVEGQPVSATGMVPAGTDFSKDWKHFFQWQQATGTVRVADAQVAALARFLPGTLSPQGRVDVEVSLGPKMELAGGISVRGAATRPLASLGPIQDLEARVKLAGHKVELETLTGLIGGEPFAVNGSVDLDRRNPATGMPAIQLQVRGQSLPLARQPELILRSDLNLTVANPTNGPTVVSGSVHLRDSVFLSDLRVLVPGKIAQPRLRPPYFSVDAEPLAGWKLNLQVSGERFLKVRSPFFRGEVSSNLKLEGTLKEPMALGEITVNSGVIQFPFANLDIGQGIVSLSSADPYHPHLFVNASARTFGYDVRMEATGTADAPIIQFTSAPPLSSEQILLMLSAGQLPQGETAMSTQQRAGRLALFVGKNLLSEFTSGPGAADRLTVHSGENLLQQGRQSYSLEYRLNKDWSIVGEYDQFNDLNVGLKWRLYSR